MMAAGTLQTLEPFRASLDSSKYRDMMHYSKSPSDGMKFVFSRAKFHFDCIKYPEPIPNSSSVNSKLDARKTQLMSTGGNTTSNQGQRIARR